MTQERKTVDIIISDDLRNVLLEIQDSQVAQLLVKGTHFEDELADDYVNYISISKKDLTKISYLTKERYEGLSIDECWATTKRIMAKPGGFISKVFKNISEKEVEKFSTLFRSEVSKPKLDFQVFEGDEVKKFYHYSSYCERNGGSLHASCMKYDNCQSFLDIYTKNPDNCKIVVLFDNDDATRIIGRAILWHVDGHKVMDRIYTINDEAYQFYFKQWASKHGYYFKSEQNWFNTRQFEMLGSKKINLDLILDLPNAKFDRVPYMDTFKFMDYEGKLYNFQPKGTEYYTLTDTGGRKNGYDHLITDYIDGVLRYRGEAYRLRYLETEDRVYTHPNNCNYSEIMDTYILKDHCIQHPVLRDYIFNDEYKQHNNDQRIQERVKYVEEREIQRQKEREERDARRARQREEMNARYEGRGYENGRLYGEIDDYMDIMNQMRGLRNRYSLEQLYPAVTEYLDLRRHGYRGTLEDLLHEIGVRNDQRGRRVVRRVQDEVVEAPRPVPVVYDLVDTPLSEVEPQDFLTPPTQIVEEPVVEQTVAEQVQEPVVEQPVVEQPQITTTRMYGTYDDSSTFRVSDTMFRMYYDASGSLSVDIETDTTREPQTEGEAE